ncbi:hypothetical protein IEQ34_015123 [Dendrobium chrysotoxum]|uniref:Uncharacterized protein n=1 Tax=Dendrobium chrysotoxum TaxID=161865 RepID=A0AAV7GL05_DENCH|nr:hypothetical protein IEQ34_015123 [Dendrobium chrysotoxum]
MQDYLTYISRKYKTSRLYGPFRNQIYITDPESWKYISYELENLSLLSAHIRQKLKNSVRKGAFPAKMLFLLAHQPIAGSPTTCGFPATEALNVGNEAVYTKATKAAFGARQLT